jgi:hypothetical protein
MGLAEKLIVFGVITLAAVLFLNNLEDARDIKRSKEAALLTLRQKTIPDFVKAAVNYETAVYVAYVDLYQWEGTRLTQPMRELETKYYPQYLASAELIKASFSSYDNIIEATNEYMAAIEALFRIYDNVRDMRLDNGPNAVIHPEQKREAFDAAREKAKKLRRALLPLISEVVYREFDAK